MGNPVIHFEVMGKDAAKLHSFYTSLFDWDIQADPEGYGMVNTGEGNITGGVAPAEQPGVTFFVGVDDCQAALDKAVSLGGKVVMPPTAYGEMVTFALFSDPEGNVVGVAKPNM
jgi:predicted enzyme related to lactoylglutathione lyase